MPWKKKITRKELLRGGAMAAGASLALATPAIAQGRREIRLASGWKKDFPGFSSSSQRIANNITEMSDGKLTVRLFTAGELAPAYEIFDLVSAGNAELYHGIEFWWPEKPKTFAFFTTTPFGLTATEMKAWIHHGGGQELWDEFAGGYGVKSFLAGNTGVQMGGWFRKEIETLTAFKGIRMRIGGFGGEVVSRVGASAVSIPGADVFQALQFGAIDATEWVGPWSDLVQGFHKVAKYYYYPGWHEPSTSMSVGANLDFWNSLSKSEQTIIAIACQAENDALQAEFHYNNGKALARLVEMDGVQLRPFSDEILRALGAMSKDIIAEAAQEDALTKKIYDSYMTFHKEARRITETADEPYARARSLAFDS